MYTGNLAGSSSAHLDFLIRLLGKVFSSSAISSISDVLVYGLITVAVLVLPLLDVPHHPRRRRVGRVGPPSASDFQARRGQCGWQSASRRDQGTGATRFISVTGVEFHFSRARDCGVQMWRAPRANICACCPPTDTNRDTLRLLTRSFEVVWYARRSGCQCVFRHFDPIGENGLSIQVSPATANSS